MAYPCRQAGGKTATITLVVVSESDTEDIPEKDQDLLPNFKKVKKFFRDNELGIVVLF